MFPLLLKQSAWLHMICIFYSCLGFPSWISDPGHCAPWLSPGFHAILWVINNSSIMLFHVPDQVAETWKYFKFSIFYLISMSPKNERFTILFKTPLRWELISERLLRGCNQSLPYLPTWRILSTDPFEFPETNSYVLIRWPVLKCVWTLQ